MPLGEICVSRILFNKRVIFCFVASLVCIIFTDLSNLLKMEIIDVEERALENQ